MIEGAVLLIILGVGYVQVTALGKRVKALEDAAPTVDERARWEAAVREALGTDTAG